MTTRQSLLVGTSVLASCLFWACRRASVEPMQGRVVRLAELEMGDFRFRIGLDAAQLERYQAALKEEVETSIRAEPGVLTLYAVAVKGYPNQIRIFENYANTAAYQAHLKTPHFLKYKTATQGMVKSLRLIETDPIVLGSKFR